MVEELELIRLLTRDLPVNPTVKVGAGDDCAVLDLGIADRYVLFKADAVVEGIHFTADAPAEKVGHKALARCLSDIAAMAGTPSSALVTLGLPGRFEPQRVTAIYRGLSTLARRWGVAIVGGETTTNPDRILVAIAMLGTVAKDKCVLRSGAKPGDALFVTGQLGGSLAGKHLEFEPRLAEARWLADRFAVSSMIDLSDGLATDLRHVLAASQVGAELLAGTIPISRAARLAARGQGASKPPLLAALTDGEDFELLFTVPAAEAVAVLDAWKAQFAGLSLACIGKITAAPGLKLRDRRGVRELTVRGYEHFA